MKLRSDAIIIVSILIALWFMWFLSGGPERMEAKKGPFLKPPAPISTGEIYGDTPDLNFDFKLGTKNFITSKHRTSVKALGVAIKEVSPAKEYLDITNKSSDSLNITGWQIVNENGTSAKIGRGVQLFVSGEVRDGSDIILRPGETAHIISGQSPVGVSFKQNVCSGYLSQFQKFVPPLSKNCPLPVNAENLSQYRPNPICLNFLNSLPSCSTVTNLSQIPRGSDSSCEQFIEEHATYNGCVRDNRNNNNFYEPYFMVYLGSNKELWKSNDTLRVLDREGKNVTTVKQTFLNI